MGTIQRSYIPQESNDNTATFNLTTNQSTQQHQQQQQPRHRLNTNNSNPTTSNTGYSPLFRDLQRQRLLLPASFAASRQQSPIIHRRLLQSSTPLLTMPAASFPPCPG